MASSRSDLTEAIHQLFLLTLLILLSASTFAQELLPSGFSHSFSPNETSKFWVSESRANYTFGFKALTQPAGAFLLAVWHSKDQEQTPIWWAARNGEGPVLATQGSSFLYNESSGFLELQDASSKAFLWRSSKPGSAQFLDTGNVQLLNGNASVWATFQDQRNTLMLLSLTNSVLENRPRLLQSTENQTSYANGKFHMGTSSSLQIQLFGIDKLNSQYLYLRDENVSAGSSGISIQSANSNRFNSVNRELERLTLDYDGNLRVYRWSESSASWETVWAVMSDGILYCRAQNPCGPFGICDVETSSCSCPAGYSPLSSNDISRGCATARSPPGCSRQSGNQLAVMVQQPAADFYYNDIVPMIQVRGIEECKALCLRDCRCIAAVLLDVRCFLKGNASLGYLVNGITNGDKHTLLLKFLQMPPEADWHLVPITVALAVSCAAIAVGLGIAWWRGGARRDLDLNARPVRFNNRELVEMTVNYRHLLGEGASGKVYKGWLNDGKSSHPIVVAVKVLKQTPTEKHFHSELTTLSHTRHVNLVSLLGFCISGRKSPKISLVFEHMEHGSLDRYLSPLHRQQPLPWSIRFSIAAGAARGIAYLHHECNPPILHCDIKPQNVLLGKAFEPKVADFGSAARFCSSDQSHLTMSKLRGTPGFVAPDWYNGREITLKADVYSFGMLLMELVNGLDTTEGDRGALIEWARGTLAEGSAVSPSIAGSTSARQNPEVEGVGLQTHLPEHKTDQELEVTTQTQQQQQHRLLAVALRCIDKSPDCRPSMSEVVRWIEGYGDLIDSPTLRM